MPHRSCMSRQIPPTTRSHIYEGLFWGFRIIERFLTRWLNKIMSANGSVRNVYDSTCLVDKEGITNGPEIVISSRASINAKDMKAFRESRHLMLYLPPPMLGELHSIQAQFFADISNRAFYLFSQRRLALIDRLACLLRTILNCGDWCIDLDDIEESLHHAQNRGNESI